MKVKALQWWFRWTSYGVPRCWAYDGTSTCGRLIWPWQATSGNGEEVRHAHCQAREERWFERELRKEAG